MYVGRFIVVAPGRAAYRVSSRSFPNRRVIDRGGTLTVAPTAAAPETDNPYISYNCLRTTAEDTHAVVGNGTQVDPITENLESGYPPRDALAESLLALDYEKDDYDTPRIAGVVGEESYVGIVRRDALLVESVGEPTLVATYEEPLTIPAYVDTLLSEPGLGAHASKYLLAAIEHAGTRTVVEEGEETERYRFFDDPWNTGEHAILGNTAVLNRFVDDLRSIAAGRGKEDQCSK